MVTPSWVVVILWRSTIPTDAQRFKVPLSTSGRILPSIGELEHAPAALLPRATATALPVAPVEDDEIFDVIDQQRRISIPFPRARSPVYSRAKLSQAQRISYCAAFTRILRRVEAGPSP